jgi:hypothetical protein
MFALSRPTPEEYAPFYAGYVGRVPEKDILAVLERQLDEFPALLGGLGEERALSRYAAGKWSVKEVVGHIVDGERVFSYRALRFARGDRTPLAGFEQEGYVANGGFDRRPLADLLAEWEHLRRANLLFFRHLDAESWGRSGIASNAEVTVRALAYILAGHLRHHLAILTERYLGEEAPPSPS